MGTMRHRDSCLPVFLLAGFFVLALGTDAAWPAVAGGHGGGHADGFMGSGSGFAAGIPRGGRFRGGRFSGHRSGHARHGQRGFFPFFAGYPYDYGYDLDYDPRSSHDASPRGHPNGGHCDVSSNSYPQFCVWKDGQ